MTDLREIQDRLYAIDAALIEKNYTRPECDLTIEASGDAIVWIKCGSHGETDRIFENVDGETLNAVFNAADKYVADLPDMADHKKKEAVKQFGRAVDGLRDAGIDAKFVDPLSDTMKAMSENLLTYEEIAS